MAKTKKVPPKINRDTRIPVNCSLSAANCVLTTRQIEGVLADGTFKISFFFSYVWERERSLAFLLSLPALYGLVSTGGDLGP
jgi:hypothetical protein